MGQKVNPHGLRVGVIKDWDSRWFADKSTFGDTLVEDYNIREYVMKTLNRRSKNANDKCVYAGFLGFCFKGLTISLSFDLKRLLTILGDFHDLTELWNK